MKDKRKGLKYKISKYNQKALNDFIANLKSNGIDNKFTVNGYETSIRKTLSIINKDYNKITIKDLDKVFSNIKSSGTRELLKIKFKCFLKFYKLNELSDHIKINSKYFRTSNKTDNDILTPEEINKIINAKLSIRDKAVFELFITTGIRRGEFIELKYQNIEDNKDEIIVKITDSKTIKRNISIIPYPNNPIAFFPKNFYSYYQNHIFKDEPEKPLFYSIANNSQFNKLNSNSLSLFFNKIKKAAKINKKLTPHIIRHTSASWDGYHLTEKELELKYGWNPGSDMPTRYCHLNEKNFNENLKRKAGLTPITIEEDSKCPYCNAINNINAIKCKNCQRIINREEMAKQINQREKRDKAIEEEITNLRNDLNFVIKYTNELINKQLFLSEHMNKYKEMELKYKRLHKEGKITKDEYIQRYKEEGNKFYNKNHKKIKIENIDDLRNLKKDIIYPLAKKMIK